MTQLSKENGARPNLGRAFFNRNRLPSARAHLVYWPTLVVGIILDLWTKTAVFNWLGQTPRDSFTVINGFLQLIAVQNAGAAFGIAAGRTAMLILFSCLALVVIFAVFLASGREHTITHLALAMFAAGICGNLYDRIFNDGLVRDFIDVVYWPGKHWPTFNIADSMLCVAVALIVISGLFTPAQHEHDTGH